MNSLCVAVLLVGTLCYAQNVESDKAKLETLASAMKSWSQMTAGVPGYLVQRHLHKDSPHFIDASGSIVNVDEVCAKPTVAPTHPPKMPGGLPVVVVHRVKEMFAKLKKVLQEQLCKVVNIVYSSNRAYPVIAKLAGCKDPKMDAILELGDVILAPKKHTSTKKSLCDFAKANSKTLENGAAKATAALLPFLRVGTVLPSKPVKKVEAKNLKSDAAKAVAGIAPFLRVGTVLPSKPVKKANAKNLKSAVKKLQQLAKKFNAKNVQPAAAKAAGKAIAPFLRVGAVRPSKPAKKVAHPATATKADLEKLKSFLPHIRVGTVVSGNKPVKKAGAKHVESAVKTIFRGFVKARPVQQSKPVKKVAKHSKPVKKVAKHSKPQPSIVTKPVKEDVIDVDEPKIADETGFGSSLQGIATYFGGDSDSFEDDVTKPKRNHSRHGNGSHHHHRRHHRHHHRHHHLLSHKVRVIMFYSGAAILGLAMITILVRSFVSCRRTRMMKAHSAKFGSNNYAALVDAEEESLPGYSTAHSVSTPSAV